MTTPLRFLLLGLGRVFRRHHLPALRSLPDAVVVGACDPEPAAREHAAREWPGIPVVAEAGELLATCQADAALVLTPPRTHAELASVALDAGLHLLVEKPLATAAKEAAALVERAAAARRLIQVGYNRRLRPSLLALRRAMADRKAAPWQLRLRLVTPGAHWGRGGAMEAGAVADELLFDLGTHVVDLAPWLADAPVERVRAKPLQHSGKTVALEAELALADGSRAYCRVGYGRRFEEHVIARSQAGVLVATPWTFHRGRWNARTGFGDRVRRIRDLSVARLGLGANLTERGFRHQLEAFVRAIRGGRIDPPLADADAGTAAVRALDAWRCSLADAGAWSPVPGAAGETQRS